MSRDLLKIIKKVKINSEGELWINDKLVFKSEDKQIGKFLKQIYKNSEIDYPKYYKMDKLSKLGYIASEIIYKDVEDEVVNYEDTAIIIFNKNSTIDTDRSFYDSFEKIPSPAVFVYTLPNIVIGEISIRYGFKGENRLYIINEFKQEELFSKVKSLASLSDFKYCLCGYIDVLSTDEYYCELYLLNC